MKGLPAILALAALISATLPAVPLATPRRAALAMAPASLEFEVNRGQAPEGDYIAHGPGYTLALTATEMTLRVRRAPDPTLPKTSHGTTEAILRLRLVGARPDAIGAGLEQ